MIRNQHISFTQALWKKHLNPLDLVIDATCGHGLDAVFLSHLPVSLVLIDIQLEAINSSRKNLAHRQDIAFYHQSHTHFPSLPKPPRLIVYNLGYLPGGNKRLTTQRESTLMSLQAALDLLAEDGLISMMCYPGHEEGALEAIAIKKFVQHHPHKVISFFENPSSPFLILLAKLKKSLPI